MAEANIHVSMMLMCMYKNLQLCVEPASIISVAISFSSYLELLTPPTQLTVLEISPTTFTVSWKPPQGNLGNRTTLYFINVTDTEGESALVFQADANGTALQLRVAELFPNHLHQVSVAAISEEEETGPAAFMWIKTSPLTSMYICIWFYKLAFDT